MENQDQYSNEVSFEIDLGETFYKPFIYVDDLSESVNAVDVSAYTAKFTIRTTDDATGVALLQATTENAQIFVDGKSGKLEVWIAASLIRGLGAGRFRYSMFVTSPTGLVECLCFGDFIINARVQQ